MPHEDLAVAACLLCQDVIDTEASEDGPLISDEYVVAYHLMPNDRFPKQSLGRVLLVTRRSLDAIDRGVELLKLRLRAFDHSVEVCAELCVDHVVRRFERCTRTGARSNEDDQHASLLHQFSDGHTHAAPFDPTADITNQKS